MYTPSSDHPLAAYVFYTLFVGIRYIVIAMGAYWILWKVLPKFIENKKIVKDPLPVGQKRREVFYALTSVLIFAGGGLVNLFISDKKWGLYYSHIQDFGWGYWVFSIFAMLAISEIHFYFFHRLLHTPFLYKKIHAVHHMSRQTTPMTSQAFSPAESLVNISVVFIIPFVIPLHISAYLVFANLAFLYNVYGHCGYEFWPKSWMQKVPFKYLNTSTAHSWHHQKVNGNYGLYVTILDRLFGTFRDPYK